MIPLKFIWWDFHNHYSGISCHYKHSGFKVVFNEWYINIQIAMSAFEVYD
jgi:hypothetical protein